MKQKVKEDQWNKVLVLWKDKQGRQTASQTHQKKEREMHISKSKNKKVILKQLPLKSRGSLGNILKIYTPITCKF
jgi:hypothetical protein